MTTTPTQPALPENHKLTSENTAQILIPITEKSDNKAFINPIQEFNRDLSVAAIKVWSEIVCDEKSAKFKQRLEKNSNRNSTGNSTGKRREPIENPDWVHNFSILDALSATGLRAIRYAKEIPNANRIYANDFSPDAVAAIRQNVTYNQLQGRVNVTEGDASALMYQHRSKAQFDVIDLDPYGTAAPFIDAAVQSLSSGGLLCITCTDTAVMAGTNYPEKCFTNYGGTPVRAEYTHEAALRLILNSISQSASRYGRYIEPMMSLSIDFYVRMWVRIHDGSAETKKAFSKTGSVHVCSFCRAHTIQPFGRIVEKVSGKGNVSSKFQAAQSVGVGSGVDASGRCSECHAHCHTNGPMWIDKLHNKAFTQRLLQHVTQAQEGTYGTATRMKGMVSTAHDELDEPFYFTTDSVASAMKLTAPSMVTVGSGLVNAGYAVSRSHALPGSIKTDAPVSAVHDMMRKWMLSHPVKLENVKEGSPTRHLLTKEPRIDADLTHNQKVVDLFNSKEKIRRYQANPANWGPLARPARGDKIEKQGEKDEKVEDKHENTGDERKNVGDKRSQEHLQDRTDITHTKKAKYNLTFITMRKFSICFVRGDARSVYDSDKPVNANSKAEQLATATRDIPTEGDAFHRTTFGAKADNVEVGMKAGRRGPYLLSDPIMRDKVSHFDHERIPERVVHARGDAAHGFFKLHTSLEDVTHAKVLNDTESETPMFVRFSTVLGSSGAAETAREVQDGMKFPDLIHAAKPEPRTGIPQAQTAHDNFWDFISLSEESTHMASWVLSDATIPRSYRMIQGFGVNTFVFVNKEGKRTFVKFHWKPHLGHHSLCWDEALKLGGQDPDFLRRDLYMFIDAGIYPKYEFGVQLVPEEDEDKFSFDLLDCTKIIPEEEVPIKWVGTMTLNRTVTDQFAENEQVAFCTNNIVPGIDYSDDPMLQVRNFSYFDTQISRLGGINFSQIPINQPIPQACPFMNTLRDGSSSKVIPSGPNYYPNRFNNNPGPASVAQGGLHHPPYKVGGVRERNLGPKFFEYYDQATLHYNSLSDVEKNNYVNTAAFEIGRCDDRGVQERMMERFKHIDYDLAKSIASNFGIDVGQPVKKNHGRKTDGSNPISMLSKNNTFKAEGRLIAMIAPDGFDYQQAVAVQKAFSSLGNIVAVIGTRKGPTYGKNGEQLDTQFTFELARSTYFDSLIFLDGNDTYQKTLQMGRPKHWCIEAYAHYKPLAVVGSSAEWASKLIPITNKIEDSKSFSVQDGVVVAPNLTNQDTGLLEKLTHGVYDAATFAGAYAQAIAGHRYWRRDNSTLAY
ncbi:hypothetical protein E3P98_03947 [Wallemia ichthyophaga]|nr:hypothetical protein E3P98_03947 [Wallemia ichthyophaga]